MAKEFPGETEVTAFTSTLIPLLAEAMHWRGRPLADADYYDQARPLQQQIEDLVEQPAQHLGVRQVQCIFHDNAHRVYHWATNRADLIFQWANSFGGNRLTGLRLSKRTAKIALTTFYWDGRETLSAARMRCCCWSGMGNLVTTISSSTLYCSRVRRLNAARASGIVTA